MKKKLPEINCGIYGEDIILIDYMIDSCEYFEKLIGLKWPIFLDSGYPKQSSGRYDIISADPLETIICLNGSTVGYRSGLPSASYDSPWAAISNQLSKNSSVVNLNNKKIDGKVSDFPTMMLGRYGWALIQDHFLSISYLVFTNEYSEFKREALMSLLFSGESNSKGMFKILSPIITDCKKKYFRDLERIKTYLLNGDCYQINYSKEFSAEYAGDTFMAYKYLRDLLPSQYSCYFKADGQEILSFSPESFLKVDGRNVISKPIKGTSPRYQDQNKDIKSALELQKSLKDRAENIMIVDLIRNDLNRVCVPGSVGVENICEIESYANVHHLVSTIYGFLREDEGLVSLLKVCFPGGSITGAPKIRAMEIIDELESFDRRIYCGSVGYIGYNGRMNLNISIRTLFADGKVLRCWAGGGIVMDSDPQKEYEEVMCKIGIILDGLSKFG